MATDSSLHQVALLNVPVNIWERSRVWFEGLMREFAIISTETEDGPPKRLTQFVGEVSAEFSRFGQPGTESLRSAWESGLESVDLKLALPPMARQASRDLLAHIEEAETFCRDGDMLTLTPEPDVRQFVAWYLTEIPRQLEGSEPTPWTDTPSSALASNVGEGQSEAAPSTSKDARRRPT